MTNVSYWIAPGVFSKSYDLPDGDCTCITYHTPSLLTRATPCVLALFVFLLTALSSAQTAVTPAGTGTEADPYQITVLGNLVWMGETTQASDTSGKFYKQINDIDAAATNTWNDGQGFAPIGSNSSTYFQGNYDGTGKTIYGLYISRTQSTAEVAIGLFGYTTDATIRNLGIVNASISGSSSSGALVGGLAGYSNNGTFTNCYATGNIAVSTSSSGAFAGGLVGMSATSPVANCYTTANVTATSNSGSYAGGLIGNSSSSLTNCYATGTVSADSNTIYANSDAHAGGLVGVVGGGSTINSCYATGSVSGTAPLSSTATVFAGGLVARITEISHVSAIINSYATGSVSATTYATRSCIAGGLVGAVTIGNISISNCYAIGSVSSVNPYSLAVAGGLVGDSRSGTITNCYWDRQTSGLSTSSGGGIGKTTDEMKQQATFNDWDFNTVWGITPTVNSGYPFLTKNTAVGCIAVTIEGTAEGQWRIVGESYMWRNSGTSVTVPIGNYTVEFSVVPDYDTPEPQVVTVTKDATASVTVDYRKTSVHVSETFLY